MFSLRISNKNRFRFKKDSLKITQISLYALKHANVAYRVFGSVPRLSKFCANKLQNLVNIRNFINFSLFNVLLNILVQFYS